MIKKLTSIGRPKVKIVLSQAIPWEQVLTALEIPAPVTPALPAITICPFCQGKFVIYPDIRGGTWCQCVNCKWAGDVIELGTKIWQLDVYNTLRKYESRGVVLADRLLFKATTDRYQKDILDYRAQINEFWQTSSKFSFQDTPDVARLHDQFMLNSQLDPARWYDQLGKYIGGANVRDAVRSLLADKWSLTTPYLKTIFPGGEWHNVLVLPTYDMPGRISGFWFTGRAGRYPDDWCFYRVERYKVRAGWGSPMDEREAGLAFYNPEHIYHKHFKDTIFVVNQPVLATMLHGRHLRDHSEYLPLVLAYDGPQGNSRKVWQCFPKSDLVFWSEQPTPNIFAQARAADGRVALLPFEPEVDLRRHMTWLRKARQQALYWPVALMSQLDRLTDPELEAVLIALELDHEDPWRAFLEHCPVETHPRLTACRTRRWPFPAVQAGGHRVAVRPEGWVSEQTGELISSVIPDVTHAYVKPVGNGKSYTYYTVVCRYKDQEWSFTERSVKLRSNLASLIEQEMIAAGLGIPRFSPMWRYRLLDVALKFSHPTIVKLKRKRKKKQGVSHASPEST